MGLIIDEFETPLWSEEKLIVGIDEAGRGPMAGPCVVCGVVFRKGFFDARINDSKKLSARLREELVTLIEENALWTKTIIITPQEIDQSNIYKVTQDAMQQIANEAPCDVVLTDAMKLPVCNKPVESLIKGDQRSLSIAAASILAKTKRDAIMVEYSKLYPQYGFEHHKGYGTKLHMEAIRTFGRTDIHRMSFKFKNEKQMSLDFDEPTS